MAGLPNIQEYIKKRRRQIVWKKVLCCMAVLVVFCTVYALILPAITLENTTCGLKEHIHTEECYAQPASAEKKELICSLETLGVHTHSSSCFDDEGNIICGYADFVVHTHDENCYDSNGALICYLPEIKEHIHSDICYGDVQEKTPVEGHTHTEECYEMEQGELICQLEESEGHTHSEECYDEEGSLICQLKESEGHIHGEECYEEIPKLVCDKEEQEKKSEQEEKELICSEKEIELHMHTPECYTNGALTCGKLEIQKHVHTKECFVSNDMQESELVCGMEEHTHEESCMAVQSDSVQLKSTSATKAAGDEAQSIFTYTDNKPKATAEITVADMNNQIIQPVDGVYHVVAGQDYYVRLTVASEEGMDPGLYYCTFPEGQTLKAEEGRLMLRDDSKPNGDLVDVGRWYLDQKTNRLMFDIEDNIKNFTNLTLSATVTVVFVASDQPLDFDGKIQIKVDSNGEKEETEVSKWARRNVENADPGKIYWEAEIDGNKNSKIIGSTFSDEIKTPNTHHYTDSDKENGVKIEAYYYGESSTSSKPIEQHSWTITPKNTDMTWTETGWNYTIPEEIHCSWCGETFSPGGDGWIYYLKYTSTILEDGTQGYVRYENKVMFDGDEATGKTDAGAVNSGAKVIKNASYHSSSDENIDNDTISWMITAMIPGAKENHKYEYYWHLWDGMSLKQGNNDEGYNNDLNNATVTAIVGGERIEVPELEAATENDQFCWENNYSEESKKGNGIWSGRQITLYSRCTCTEENCPDWENGKCAHKNYKNDKGFCRCWCYPDDVTFYFNYETKAKDLIEHYGGQNAKLYNYVELDNQQRNSNNNNAWQNVRIDHSSYEVPIPGVFSKANTDQPDKNNNQIAEFTITVNETMKDLGAVYNEVTINDEMSNTLIFLPDTLTITAEDVDGVTHTLSDTDYTVIYDSTTPHTAKIVLVNPGKYKYTLVYNARISVPAGTTETDYSNTADVYLFGKERKDTVEPTLIQDIVATGENYSVKLVKTDKENQDTTLPGAVFGLFNQDGKEICEIETGDEGSFTVSTDTEKGIFFYEHTPCYFQELKAPEGYELDSTKHWFWFCKQGADNCNLCSAWEKSFEEKTGEDAHRIYNATASNINVITIGNQKQQEEYELPETGGSGILPYMFGGIILLAGALIYYCVNRKRKNTMRLR